MSKDNYCKARVIDVDINENNLSLNDWVQLYGRVRTSTASIENATASNALPLILSMKSKVSMSSDYLNKLNETEQDYLKEAKKYVEQKRSSQDNFSVLEDIMYKIDKEFKDYIDGLINITSQTSRVTTHGDYFFKLPEQKQNILTVSRDEISEIKKILQKQMKL